MSDKFVPVSMKEFTSWIFNELDNKKSIFGIPAELFFRPSHNDCFKQEIYSRILDTPFGVAAGPHTQMAQNIIVSWLCGARFIELKTVQTLDELEISKPCIDMLDVGYNCEWSQELKLQQSFEEYLRAWVLIYALHNKLGFPGKKPGFIFNLSVGYNLEGILTDNIQNFLKNMKNAGSLLDEYIEIVAEFYPEIKELDIPSCLSDNVTLSTMHGCPPDEIGKIAGYLIEECGYNTNVKLNPTLLGSEELRRILNTDLGFREITIPDIAFEHDLKYKDAVPMLIMLQEKADRKGVTFGVKLSNTLEVINHRNVFDKKEQMMYLSGRPLQAVTVNLAKKLAVQFNGMLLMSYAGGADCFNVSDLVRSGMRTITVSSDILRPGGYTRLLQYINNLDKNIKDNNCSGISDYISTTAKKYGAECNDVKACAFFNLKQYAEAVLKDPKNLRDTYLRKNTKTDRELNFFDCIKALCTDACPINQNVPEYLRQVVDGDINGAAETIRKDNAIATILGRACNHECEAKCLRTHYDEPLAIRELKRFIVDNADVKVKTADKTLDVKVTIVGAGPGGLSTAYFLIRNGCDVTLLEERDRAAGMVSKTIPDYRATEEAINKDMDFLESIGVKIKYNCKVGKDITVEELRKSSDYVVIAVGAQKGVLPGIEGEDAVGVMDGIDFLHTVKAGIDPKLGKKIGIIGAGDVAMDCARVANRLTNGEVSVIYRRTVEEMPAHKEELDGLLAEGIDIKELCAPNAVITKNEKIIKLKCIRMKLDEPDESGRRCPVQIKGSEFLIDLDNLILAIGQKPDFEFLKGVSLKYNRKGYIEVNSTTMATSVEGIYAVGDAVEHGPQTIVKAAGDGKKAAKDILAKAGVELIIDEDLTDNSIDKKEYIIKRATREFRVEIPELALDQRNNFNEIVKTLNRADAKKEASRCLRCDKYCGTCVSVCPNKALLTYEVEPEIMKVPVINGNVELFKIAQKYQVAVFTSFCNECGNCATFCPTAGKPYADKVRLYNNEAEFEGQVDNAFMIFNNKGKYSIKGKFSGEVYELVINDDLVCSNNELKARVDKYNFSLKELKLANRESTEEISLKNFAVMFTVLKGIKNSVSEIPFN